MRTDRFRRHYGVQSGQWEVELATSVLPREYLNHLPFICYLFRLLMKIIITCSLITLGITPTVLSFTRYGYSALRAGVSLSYYYNIFPIL